MITYKEIPLDNTFLGHPMYKRQCYYGRGEAFGGVQKCIKDIYAVYRYKDSILVKHGDIVLSNRNIFENARIYVNKDDCKKNSVDILYGYNNAPYICVKGKVWVLNKEEIPEAIEIIQDYICRRLNEDKERDEKRKNNAVAVLSA